jgi:O-antigen/teichoic acid export membrane protein/glycosyltransferase involved in cell wall biosynthesis
MLSRPGPPPLQSRLVFLVNAPGNGGAEQHSVNFAKEAQRRGARVLVVVPPGSALLPRLVQQSIPYRVLAMGMNIGRWRGFLGTALLFNPFAWLAFAAMLRALADEEPSIFVCPFPREQLLATWLGRSHSVQTIWIVHTPLTYLPHRLLVRPAWLRLAGRAGAVIPISVQLARSMRLAGRPIVRLAVIPNAVVVGEDDGAANTTYEPQLIGVLSRLTHAKGVQYLIAAMPIVVQRFPDAKLVIAGTGRYEQALKRRARELRMAEHIEFLGHCATPLDVLRQLEVFVCPSAEPRETMPTAILEAGSLGIPTVATSVGGIPDLITHGKTGLLVPARDARALADAICRLLSQPEDAHALGRAAREFVLARHSLAVCTERFLRVASALDDVSLGDVLRETSPRLARVQRRVRQRARLMGGATLFAMAKVVAALATAWWTILAARALAPSVYGSLMLAAGIAEIGAIFTDAGITAVATREIASVSSDYVRVLTGTIINIKLVLGGLATGLLLLLALLLPSDMGVRSYLLVLAPGLLFVSLNSLTLVYRARLALRTTVLIAALAAAVGSGLALLAYVEAPTGLAFSGVRLLSATVAGLATLAVVAAQYRPRLGLNLRLAWRLFASGAMLGVAMALNVAYYRVDVPLLALLTNTHQVAIYTSAYRILDIVTLLPASMAGVALPLMAGIDQRHRLREFAQDYLEIATALGLLAALVLTFGGNLLLNVLYAGRYGASWPVLEVLAWAGAATFVTNVFSPLVVVLDRRRAFLTATAVGLVVNVGLNFLLIPRLGVVGPAYATLATELVVTTLLAWAALRTLHWRLRVRHLALIALATAATLLAAPALRAWGLAQWQAAAGALAVWALVLLPTILRWRTSMAKVQSLRSRSLSGRERNSAAPLAGDPVAAGTQKQS